ncbi:uncharacterized protein MONBRDRAFT_39216 [Monosiga brevicollis MX1]|uniref:CCHC-type domain-containing protein n=1 Tax=Monosiga brevicollis TaxID=81824 RepID=A9VCZ2_MONBE|nr:uncharacterized protein MONBRDRAFT_39216 [Monosiga brevicollis MX1]EDQ84553.1 predicted protein [Monosiga brevicollis MX1]|eukprot:XP_001750580.1 hypothetical protein [Monosiga brevicollis MX1]
MTRPRLAQLVVVVGERNATRQLDAEALARAPPTMVRRTWFQSCLKAQARLPFAGFEYAPSRLLPTEAAARELARADQQDSLAKGATGAAAIARRELERAVEGSGRPFGYWSSRLPEEPRPRLPWTTVFDAYERSFPQRLAVRQYFCYNCGQREHSARTCPQPLRGTHGNTFQLHTCAWVNTNLPPGTFREVPARMRSKFLCARDHDLNAAPNPNVHILSALEDMKELLYDPRIDKLRGVRTKITTTDGLEDLPFIGAKTIRKIEDILETGTLERLEHANTEKIQAQRLFAKERIPRSEVDDMVTLVTSTLRDIDADAVVLPSGSYTRGRQTCGDVDFLLTHGDPRRVPHLLAPLLHALKATNFLTHDLTTVDAASTGTTDYGGDDDDAEARDYIDKYMGVARLRGGLHRRVDFIVLPPHEWACAALYFAGSGTFNRSMRLLARKANWSLNQRHLMVAVKRDREDANTKTFAGFVVPCLDEYDIFAWLGIEYQPPHLRNA